jgi:hypothetical protein
MLATRRNRAIKLKSKSKEESNKEEYLNSILVEIPSLKADTFCPIPTKR